MYSVWPPVSVMVRVSLGFRVWVSVSVRVTLGLGIRLGLELRFGSVSESSISCILYGLLCPLGLGLV